MFLVVVNKLLLGQTTKMPLSWTIEIQIISGYGNLQLITEKTPGTCYEYPWHLLLYYLKNLFH